MLRQPILIVEDEMLIRLDLIDVLEAKGYIIIDAADGGSAIKEIEGQQCLGGLITDINLGGGILGWEVARFARKKFADLPIIYITGDSAREWAEEGVADSILIQKPFSDSEILKMIDGISKQYKC